MARSGGLLLGTATFQHGLAIALMASFLRRRRHRGYTVRRYWAHMLCSKIPRSAALCEHKNGRVPPGSGPGFCQCHCVPAPAIPVPLNWRNLQSSEVAKPDAAGRFRQLQALSNAWKSWLLEQDSAKHDPTPPFDEEVVEEATSLL